MNEITESPAKRVYEGRAKRSSDLRPRKPREPSKSNPPTDLAVFMEPVERGSREYNVYFKGETIVTGSSKATVDACKALVERGFTGIVKVFNAESQPNYIVDVEKGARLSD